MFSDRDLFILSDSIFALVIFMESIKAFNTKMMAQGHSLKLFTRNPQSLHFFRSQLCMTQFNRHESMIVHKASILHGIHAIRFPFIALNAERQLKNKRHVLAQRVIAGTMTIKPIYDPTQPISEVSLLTNS